MRNGTVAARLLRARRVAVDRAARRRHAGAARALAAAHPEQRRRWAALSSRTHEVHAALAACGPAPGTTPLWDDYAAALADALLPMPAWDFLHEPLLLETMLVRGRRLQHRELRWLRGRADAARLAAWLREDPAGDPPLTVAEPATSATAVHHCFHLERMAAATGVRAGDTEVIVEWGGGYGGFARTVRAMASAAPPAHLIVDLPLMGALQWTYLSTVLGEDRVRLALEPGARAEPGIVTIVPAALGLDVAARPDLFVSLWGLSEAADGLQDAIAATGFLGAAHLLIAHQRDGPDTPSADRIGDLARRSGAHREPVGVLSHSTYAMR